MEGRDEERKKDVIKTEREQRERVKEKRESVSEIRSERK